MLEYLTHFAAGAFGVAAATAYWLPSIKGVERDILASDAARACAESKADLFEAINLHVRKELDALRAFKAARNRSKAQRAATKSEWVA